MFVITFLTAIVYLTIQLFLDGHQLNFKKIFISTFIIISLVVIAFIVYNSLNETSQKLISTFFQKIYLMIKYLIAFVIIGLVAFNVIKIFLKKFQNEETEDHIHWSSYFTPFIPLILILFFNFEFITAFICGLIYGVLSVYRKGIMNTFVKSAFEGGSMVMPAVVLMFGIGMLLNSIIGPGESWNKVNSDGWPVLNLLQPFLKQIVPENFFSYVLTFTLLAPLALYRGPLNVWGMGYGLAGILLASGMNPGAIMGLLLGVGQIQGVSDPTNTQNVWLANELKIDVQKILWNTLPYTWTVALLGLIAAGLKYMI